MRNVHIFTDSLTPLPQGLIKQLNIEIAPVYVVFSNAQIYKHTVDLCTEDIFRYVLEKGRLPGIAAPTTEDLIQLFKPSVSSNTDVLFISMSAEISPTYKNALAAARHFPQGRVVVVDSARFSTGTAMMIVQAASLAGRKRILSNLEGKLHSYRLNLQEELFQGKLQAVISAGNIYGLPDRILSPLKLRKQQDIRIGNLSRVLKAFKLKGELGIERGMAIISHTMAREQAEYLKKQLEEQYGFQQVILTPNINGLLCRSAPQSVGMSYWLHSGLT
ncbi:DegV domain-containing protein [compost metagenome]